MLGRGIALSVAFALAACHVTRSRMDWVERERDLEPRLTTAEPQPRTIRLTADGRLRFVEPLVCDADVMVTRDGTRVTETRANLAMVVVGVVLGSLGGVALVSGLADDDGGLLIAAGAGGLVGGAPLVVAPFFGRGTSSTPAGTERVPIATRTGQPCGDRAVTATAATLTVRGRRIYGRVDPDGYFSVPAFEFIDAFDVPGIKSVELAGVLHGGAIERDVTASLSGEELAAARGAFLASIDIDGDVARRLMKVPRLQHFDLEASLTEEAGEPVAVITCQVVNEGPGEAYGVRVVIDSEDPELDHRVIYFGHLRKGETRGAAIAIPLSPDGALRRSDLLARMRDAHDTAPQYALRGTVQREPKPAPE